MQLEIITVCRCLYRILPALCADSFDGEAADITRPYQLEYG